jgi:hypothetical protein
MLTSTPGHLRHCEGMASLEAGTRFMACTRACPMTSPGPAGPGGIAGREAPVPRAEDDGIAVDIPTRAGLVTVVFTSRDYARARPALRAYSYRGRQYAGSITLTGPAWQGSALLGLSLFPAGSPAGPAVAQAIASTIAAGVASFVHDHPGILDRAAHARAEAERARARRDLELLTAEITAAEQHLDALRHKQDRLQAIADGTAGDHPGSGGSGRGTRPARNP